MNILTETLPDFVTAENVKYGVYTDFRIWIEFDKILHSDEISTKDRFMMILCLCIDRNRCGVVSEDIMSIMNALGRFYLCGKESETKTTGKSERVINFSEDSGYIYSAFLTQYGIDLISIPYLHWFVFCALLEGLEDTRKISKIMGFRLCDPESVQNKERKKYLKRMKERYALDRNNKKQGCEAEIAEVLFNAF